jgi:RNA polymerase sigma-70 factor, ECF subfamily
MPEDRDQNHHTRAALTTLLRERVRPRFALTIDAFVTHLLGGAGLASATDPMEFARTLHLDDLYLATACVQQDEAAWAECSREHFEFMRDFAGRFLPRDSAREVTDTVIADLWQRGKLARYEGRSSLRTWLGAVTAHAALNAAKTQARSPDGANPPGPRPLDRPTTIRRPEQKEAAQLLSAMVQEAVSSLNDEDRLLLLFHYEQELSLDRIGALLHTSKATLSRRLKRIREQLRQTLEGLTRERYGSTTADVRRALDLSDVEFDLSLLLKGTRSVKGSGGDAV